MATETALFTILRVALLKGYTDLNLGVMPEVLQNNQPTQQGVPSGPVVYMDRITNRRYGTRIVTEKWVDPTDDADGYKEHTETQIYESTFQISALCTLDPANLDQLTAQDILDYGAYIMQSEATLRDLRAQDIGIERITAVRNPKFTDDRGRFESSPSFDVTLTHKQIVTSRIDVLQSTDIKIYRV